MLRLALFIVTFFLLFSACTQKSLLLNSQNRTSTELSSNEILRLAIPIKDNGYRNFTTEVITNQSQFDEFIRKIKSQKNWNKKENFLNILSVKETNFQTHNLLIYRVTEASNVIIVSENSSKNENGEIVVHLGKTKSTIGGTATVYSALAYRVKKNISHIKFDDGVSTHSIKMRNDF